MKIPRFILVVCSLWLFFTTIPLESAQLNRPSVKDESDTTGDGPQKTTESDTEDNSRYRMPSTQQRVPDPIIIQGNVIREDGSAPPFGTIIERDCGDILVKEILVDSNGFFSFKIGDKDRANRLFADAGENYYSNPEIWKDSQNVEPWETGRRQRREEPERLTGCVLQARHAGFHSTYARLGVFQKKGLINAGTIILYPVSRITGTAVSVTNLKASKEARKALKKGKKAFEKEEYGKAEDYFKSAINIYSKYAEAWIELGWLYQTQQRNEAARDAYNKASDMDKLYVNPYVRLAQLAAIEHQWKESIKYSDKAVSLDPVSFPEVFFLKALSHYNLSEFDTAETCIRRGIRIDLNHQIPKMYLLLANIREKKNDHAGSIEAMQQYLRIDSNASDADYVRSLVKKYKKISETANLTDKK